MRLLERVEDRHEKNDVAPEGLEMPQAPKVLEVREVIQAGDHFLIRFLCPLCNETEMASAWNPTCRNCRQDFIGYAMTDPGRSKRRCLAGTRRKNLSVSKRLVRTLIAIYEDHCAYCNSDISLGFHIDHIVPVSFGGSNSITNLALACSDCNLKAGSLVFPAFAAKRDWLLSERQRHRKR